MKAIAVLSLSRISWHQLKTSAGVYFISLEKENMNLTPMGDHRLDATDPINHGVIRDERVGSSNGVLLRRLTYVVPDTGETMVFLTHELKLPAGLIAIGALSLPGCLLPIPHSPFRTPSWSLEPSPPWPEHRLRLTRSTPHASRLSIARYLFHPVPIVFGEDERVPPIGRLPERRFGKGVF